VPPEHARRHLVGLGLALHGLGASRLRMELEPAATGSAWRIRLSDLGWSRQARSVWALDFGTSGLKVLRLVREKDAITLRNATIIPYVDATIAAESTNLQSCYAPALAAFLEQYKPADEPLVVGFSGTQSFGRFFTLPSVARKKVQALVTYEVRNQIPVSLDDVVYATHVIEHEVDASGLVQARVALVAANRALVDLRSSVFSDSSGRVRAFQSDCVALLNTLLHCYQDEFAQLAADEALALVDVGDAATNVVVASPTHGPWFRTVHRGVRSLNKLLVSKFGLTWQQADQLRQTWKAAESLAELDRVLLPGLESLTREVKLALDASRAAMQCRIAKIYVAGGGSEQFGLLREWSQPASQETGNSGGRVREPQSDSAAVTSKESA
jgi:Tfp pilus assembly PilM family ATPase